MEHTRNFCIIAHIDHGKSTLADRFLEMTGTIEKRKMKDQLLDQLDLERERGITIKMAPVRMMYTSNNQHYTLNLIDTPGHPDFGYEVSRALAAVEGAVLLVDGTQGIQAQTLSNFWAAKKAGLTIVGAINKVDMNLPNYEAVLHETADLLECDPRDIHRISGKTGDGVKELLDDLITRVPAPLRPQDTNTLNALSASSRDVGRALIFDSFYDDHKGIIAVVRVINGSFSEGNDIEFIAVRERFKVKEVGYFIPRASQTHHITEGEIGYIVTGLKDPNKIKIGDTVVTGIRAHDSHLRAVALAGYKEPRPVVFVSFFPDDADRYDDLKKSLDRLRLNDASFVFEPDFNEVLGRGFKGGFLGKLHFEITAQRLEREFGVKTTTSFPSVTYRVKTDAKKLPGTLIPDPDGLVTIYNPKDLPDEYQEIYEPMIAVEIVCPSYLLGAILSLKEPFRWEQIDTHTLGEKLIIKTTMPLAELISDFDDRLKSISGGFASFGYEEAGLQKASLARMDILVAGELVPGLSRILPKHTIEREARTMVSRLKDTLPRQQFAQAIQARVGGRFVARETIPALRKDVTGYLYGGDRTRKMKLWKKQKEGKKKLLSMAKVRISAEDFKKLLAK